MCCSCRPGALLRGQSQPTPPGHHRSAAPTRKQPDYSRIHRLEIAWQYDLMRGRSQLARISLRLRSTPAHGTKSTGERQRKRRRDTAHAGNRTELFTQLTLEGCGFLRRVADVAEKLKGQ